MKAINDGRIPCIESTLITMAQSENQKAVKQAINKYRDQAKGIDLPVSNNKILLEHHIIFAKAAMEYFSQKAIIVDESDKYFDEANVSIKFFIILYE